MQGFIDNIEEKTLGNENFRQVLYTAKSSQLVLMTLQSGEEIGEEVHEESDQFFRIEEGEGKVVIDGHETAVASETAVIVPAGATHNLINTSDKPLKLYTIYSPPHHREGVIHATKAEALSDSEAFDGQTTE